MLCDFLKTENLYSAYKKRLTKDRPILRLNYQWQSSIHLNCDVFLALELTCENLIVGCLTSSKAKNSCASTYFGL